MPHVSQSVPAVADSWIAQTRGRADKATARRGSNYIMGFRSRIPESKWYLGARHPIFGYVTLKQEHEALFLAVPEHSHFLLCTVDAASKLVMDIQKPGSQFK